MNFDKDDFEMELEAENEGSFLELKVQKEEEITDKSGIKRISKIPHIKYDLKVDLNKKEVSIFIHLPKIVLEDATKSEKEKGYNQRETVEFESIPVFKKPFLVENDTILIDNNSYKIPEFFNKDLIAQNDQNIWERIFYDILSNKIRAELEKYKTKK